MKCDNLHLPSLTSNNSHSYKGPKISFLSFQFEKSQRSPPTGPAELGMHLWPGGWDYIAQTLFLEKGIAMNQAVTPTGDYYQKKKKIMWVLSIV